MRPYYIDFQHTQARRAKAIAMARPIGWHGAPPPRRIPPPSLWGAALALLATWRKRLRERRELAALDYQMQRDIGVTPSEVEREVNKPFWRA